MTFCINYSKSSYGFTMGAAIILNRGGGHTKVDCQLVASFSASLSHFQQANSCHVFFDARSVSVLLAGHFQEGLLISAARSPCPPSHLACRACS